MSDVKILNERNLSIPSDPYSTPKRLFAQSRLISTESPLKNAHSYEIPDKESWDVFVREATISFLGSSDLWKNTIIERLHGLKPLKEGENINFQRASYALESCTKLYSARVDSLASDVRKILSCFNVTLKNDFLDNKTIETEEDIEASSLELLETPSKTLRKRFLNRNSKRNTTLAKSFNDIQIKSFDSPFLADPLYKKICSNFVEGRARSLLLNSLELDGDGCKIFDGDTKSLINDNTTLDDNFQMDIEDKDENMHIPMSSYCTNQRNFPVNLKRIWRIFFTKNDPTFNINNLTICNLIPEIQLLSSGTLSVNNQIEFEPNSDTSLLPDIGYHEDFYIPEIDNDDCEYDNDVDMENPCDTPVFFNENLIPEDLDYPLSRTLSPQICSNPVSTESMENLFEYFDDTVTEPSSSEHWRIQIVKKGISARDNISSRLLRHRKKPSYDTENSGIDFFLTDTSTIEFTNSDDFLFLDLDFAEILEPAKEQMISLPEKERENCNKNCITDDFLNTDSFSKLFLKPTFCYKEFQKRAKETDRLNIQNEIYMDYDEEVPDSFNESYGDYGYYEDNYNSPGPEIPDIPGDNYYREQENPTRYNSHMTDTNNLFSSEVIPELSNVSELYCNQLIAFDKRRTQTQLINYVKIPTNINFINLKSDMEISINLQYQSFCQNSAKRYDSELIPPTSLSFCSIMEDTHKLYEKRVNLPCSNNTSKISTATCFLALLTLANEAELLLESTPTLNDIIVRKFEPNHEQCLDIEMEQSLN